MKHALKTISSTSCFFSSRAGSFAEISDSLLTRLFVILKWEEVKIAECGRLKIKKIDCGALMAIIMYRI